MIATDQLIGKCDFPYQFLLQRIRLSLQFSHIAGKLPIGKLGRRIGSDSARYPELDGTTLEYEFYKQALDSIR
jgi:hypothetical protein